MCSLHMYVALSLTILLTSIITVQSGPVLKIADARVYLEKYSHNAHLLESKSWNSAVKELQSLYGPNAASDLNKDNRPRCGVSDNFNFSNTKRSKRFTRFGIPWHKRELTYRIRNYPKNLNKADVANVIAHAFAIWSDHTNLTFFAKASGSVDIDIQFVRGEHDYHHAFDGMGNTLAHATSPQDGGDVCFDDAERWSIGSPAGSDLLETAVHEFGHALGLDHTPISAALMFNFSKPYNPHLQLHEDDLLGIQSLYGKKSDGRVLAQATEQLCKDLKIDAIFRSYDDEIYVFKGNLYYKINKLHSENNNFPESIAEGWPGLPSNIDAAFLLDNSKTYFFKGSQYWLFTGHYMDKGYPKKINETFTGVPDDLDAAIFWKSRDEILFLKDDKYVRFDFATGNYSSSYKISSLGLPNKIHAAFMDDSKSGYFFTGHSYYRSNSTHPLQFLGPYNTTIWFELNKLCGF